MHYIFADEAGNFDFSPRGSKFFVVAAVTMKDWSIATDLLELRHRLAIDGYELQEDGFHATNDKQSVRNEVFKVIAKHSFEVDAILLEKRKTLPSIARDHGYFYRLAWRMLFSFMAKKRFDFSTGALITASSLGTGAKKREFKQSFEGVVSAYNPNAANLKVAYWTAASHPCLQVADYCTWAIQRNYDQGDSRSIILVQDKIKSCFQPFQRTHDNHY